MTQIQIQPEHLNIVNNLFVLLEKVASGAKIQNNTINFNLFAHNHSGTPGVITAPMISEPNHNSPPTKPKP